VSRTELQVFFVIQSVLVALWGVGYALEPDGSTAGGIAVVGAMATQIALALRREGPRRQVVHAPSEDAGDRPADDAR